MSTTDMNGNLKVGHEKTMIMMTNQLENQVVNDFAEDEKESYDDDDQNYLPPPSNGSSFKGKKKYGSLASTQTGMSSSDDLYELGSNFVPFNNNLMYKSPDKVASYNNKADSTAGTEEELLEREGFPDVHTLLDNCESYMRWVQNQNQNEEKILKFIQITEGKYIFPNEKFEKEETLRWNGFEHISNLGAVCYFFVQLNRFHEAKIYVGKARDFITLAAEKGYLSKEYVSSFDYIWDYLCLYASIKEWEFSGYMNLFPEMNLLTLTLKFSNLKPPVKAGVYCVKQYFYSLIKAGTDQQIDILRQAITLDPQYFEWFLCLQEVLRVQRIKYQDYHHIYPWDAEIQAIFTATLLAPNNPRVLTAGVQLLAEICKTQLSDPRWTIIRYGDINFHGLLDVKSYMKEQAEKIIKLAPKSVRMNVKIANIFTTILPYGHRDFRLGKECLERCLRYNPESCKANHRMAEFFLTVDTNYRRAEMYYELALDLNEKSFSSLTGIIQIMLRTATHRKVELMNVIGGHSGIISSRLSGAILFQNDCTNCEIALKQNGSGQPTNDAHWEQTQLTMAYWEPRQIGTLHYFKALALCANSNSREAVTSFIRAYATHERSLAFQDLPSQHRRFGWGAWSTSKLSFQSIRSDLQKERVKGDLERKKMTSLILRQLNSADASEKQFQASRQEWRR